MYVLPRRPSGRTAGFHDNRMEGRRSGPPFQTGIGIRQESAGSTSIRSLAPVISFGEEEKCRNPNGVQGLMTKFKGNVQRENVWGIDAEVS